MRHASAVVNGGPKSCSNYGSLPYDGVSYEDGHSPAWLQPGGQVPSRTVPAVLDRHREVRRCVDSEEAALNTVHESADEDPANFSDDSLEDVPPPPPPAPQPANKRSSIAWEVSLETDNEALLIPGSTKVVGRRRRKSTDHSSNRLELKFGAGSYANGCMNLSLKWVVAEVNFSPKFARNFNKIQFCKICLEVYFPEVWSG